MLSWRTCHSPSGELPDTASHTAGRPWPSSASPTASRRWPYSASPPSRSCPSCRARQRRPAAKRQEDRRLKVKDVAASHFVLGSNSTSAHSGCPPLVSEGARQLRYQSRCVTGSNNPKAKDQAPRLFHVARLSSSGKVLRGYGVGCTSSTALLCKVG